MSFDYDLKSNLVAMISNHSQSQSKLQLDKRTGLEITIVIIKVNVFCKYLSRGQLKSHSGDKQILFYNNNIEHKVSCYQIQFIFEIRKVGGS